MDEAATRHERLRWTSIAGLALKGGAILLALLSQIVLARAMSPSEFGAYAIVLAWVGILSLLAGLGMPLSAIRFLPAYRTTGATAELRGFVRQACLIGAIGSGTTTTAFLICSARDPAIAGGFANALGGAAMIPLLCFAALMTGILQSSFQPLRAEALANLIRPGLVILLVGSAAILLGPISAAVALALTCAATLIALIPAVLVAFRPLPRGPGAPIGRAERVGWVRSGVVFLVPLVCMMAMERVDTILLGAFVGVEAAGVYSVAARLAQMVGLGVAAVGALLGPLAAERLAGNDHAGLRALLANGALLNSGLGLGVALGVLILGPWLLSLFGPGFVVGTAAMNVLVIGQVAQALFGGAGIILALAGRDRALILTMLATFIGHVGLCLWLIPRHGQVGAAVAGALSLSIASLVQTVLVGLRIGVDTSILGGVRLLVERMAGRSARVRETPS